MWPTLPTSVAFLIFIQEHFYKMTFVRVPVVGWPQLAAKHLPSRLLIFPHSRMGEKMVRTGARKLMGQG